MNEFVIKLELDMIQSEGSTCLLDLYETIGLGLSRHRVLPHPAAAAVPATSSVSVASPPARHAAYPAPETAGSAVPPHCSMDPSHVQSQTFH